MAAALLKQPQALRLRLGEEIEKPAARNRARAERFRLLFSRRVVAARNGNDVNKAEPADCINVMRPNEPGANQPHTYACHEKSPIVTGDLCLVNRWLVALAILLTIRQ